mmetsp:Transcript_50809/g.99343  ORF Transcript_50809/g.99343 Transcript_50809/m.99343 type:complete len:230 (-) Transcript_50809:275-964(-)
MRLAQVRVVPGVEGAHDAVTDLRRGVGDRRTEEEGEHLADHASGSAPVSESQGGAVPPATGARVTRRARGEHEEAAREGGLLPHCHGGVAEVHGHDVADEGEEGAAASRDDAALPQGAEGAEGEYQLRDLRKAVAHVDPHARLGGAVGVALAAVPDRWVVMGVEGFCVGGYASAPVGGLGGGGGRTLVHHHGERQKAFRTLPRMGILLMGDAARFLCRLRSLFGFGHEP